MDLKKLQYFLVVAEEGHITRAAKRLNISQPPLTHQIKVFESELGVQLVEKVGRQIRITKAGYALRDRGEQIMNLVDKTVKELKDFHDGLRGTLAIGSVTAWGATLLPDRMRNFNERYPEVSFQLWDGNDQRVTELLNTGVIEIGIVPVPFDSEVYNSIILPDEPVVAAMTAEWDNKSSQDCINLTDIADKPLILHRKSEPVIEYYRQNAINPKILCMHDDVRSMLLLANAGLGVTIVPQTAANLVQSTNLIYKEITSPPLKITAAIIWTKHRLLSAAARHFLDTF